MNDEQIAKLAQKITINFPCKNYVIRIIGVNSSAFIPTVLDVLKQNVPELDESALVIRTSKTAKFITLQIGITAQSVHHLKKINDELLATKMVKMVL